MDCEPLAKAYSQDAAANEAHDLATLMLGFIYTLRVFDVIWVMTGGGPVNATEVLPTLAYRESFNRFNFGEGAAISVIMLGMLLVVAVFYVRTTNEEEM